MTGILSIEIMLIFECFFSSWDFIGEFWQEWPKFVCSVLDDLLNDKNILYLGCAEALFVARLALHFSEECIHPLEGCPEGWRCGEMEKENERNGEKKKKGGHASIFTLRIITSFQLTDRLP